LEAAVERPRPYLSAAERRNAAVEAFVDLAAERNPADITTSDIAGRMQLTQGALFRHFPTKDAIWEAVMTWVTHRLLERIEAASRHAPSPLAALEAMFLAHIGFVAEHPGVPRLIFGQLQRREANPAKTMVRALLSNYSERLQRRVRDGIELGEIRPDTDPNAAAVLFVGLIQGLVMRSLILSEAEFLRAEAPGVFALFRRALAVRP
jgi:AcrR family transcriptional regulator